jgi:hypothetical protein
MSLRTRLQRLERNTADAGCPACRDRRGRIVLLRAEQQPDGTVAVVEGEPAPCTLCGQVPKQIIEVVETVVEAPPLNHLPSPIESPGTPAPNGV